MRLKELDKDFRDAMKPVERMKVSVWAGEALFKDETLSIPDEEPVEMNLPTEPKPEVIKT